MRAFAERMAALAAAFDEKPGARAKARADCARELMAATEIVVDASSLWGEQNLSGKSNGSQNPLTLASQTVPSGDGFSKQTLSKARARPNVFARQYGQLLEQHVGRTKHVHDWRRLNGDDDDQWDNAEAASPIVGRAAPSPDQW
jgi:hypothetical protein